MDEREIAKIPILRTRFCNLDKIQMQYVNTIAAIVFDIIRLPRKMSKITDYLYLGSFDDAENIEQLKAAGITHVLNTVENCFENCKTGAEFYGNEYKYMGFTSEDIESYPILQHFDEVYKFIESARKANGKCLIHCMAGINRSGCLAVAYIMVTQNIGPISATKIVFNARGMILSNQGFIERLVKFAVDKNLLVKDNDQLMKHWNNK